jgi:hypothetical protein
MQAFAVTSSSPSWRELRRGVSSVARRRSPRPSASSLCDEPRGVVHEHPTVNIDQAAVPDD